VFGKVSTIFMLIKKTWAIVSLPQRTEVLSSDNLRILKFVQLAMSKTVTVAVKESTGIVPRPGTESELCKKIKLVHKIITSELGNIEALHLRMQSEWLQVELLDSVKEFVDIIGLTDDLVNATYELERKELLRFHEYCNQHKSFVFRTLHNIDYSQEYAEIKSQLISAFKEIEHDSKFVSSELSIKLTQQIKND